MTVCPLKPCDEQLEVMVCAEELPEVQSLTVWHDIEPNDAENPGTD